MVEICVFNLYHIIAIEKQHCDTSLILFIQYNALVSGRKGGVIASECVRERGREREREKEIE